MSLHTKPQAMNSKAAPVFRRSDYFQEYNIWIIKSRTTDEDTNTELVKQVKQVQLLMVKARWLLNLAKSALPPLCYKSSLTSSCWLPITSQSPSRSIKSVPTRSRWGCWCLQTPGDIGRSIRPRGRTIWESGSSTHRRDKGSSGQ